MTLSEEIIAKFFGLIAGAFVVLVFQRLDLMEPQWYAVVPLTIGYIGSTLFVDLFKKIYSKYKNN